MYQPKILAFAGSLRKDSFNKRTVKIAAKEAEKLGAEVTYVDLIDYPMPIYNADEHEAYGFDENALRFQDLLATHDGYLISTPAYNDSLPAALKNVVDWASRANDTYEKSEVYRGKVAAIMSASDGSLGGIKSLIHLRGVLNSVKVHVIPQEVAVTFAHEKFVGNSGEMNDKVMKEKLEALSSALVEHLELIHDRSEKNPIILGELL